jgi:uncharacterized protein with PIN domain
MFEAFDIRTVTRIRVEPLRDPRFILDVHLGRLARYLRLAGFDAEYRNDLEDAELVARAANESRILLTRDLGVLKHGAVTHGYAVRATNPLAQLTEVVHRFDLAQRFSPFTRCLRCNSVLSDVQREAVSDRVPPRVHDRHTTFRLCEGCQRVYWAGTHHARLTAVLRSALGAV